MLVKIKQPFMEGVDGVPESGGIEKEDGAGWKQGASVYEIIM